MARDLFPTRLNIGFKIGSKKSKWRTTQHDFNMTTVSNLDLFFGDPRPSNPHEIHGPLGEGLWKPRRASNGEAEKSLGKDQKNDYFPVIKRGLLENPTVVDLVLNYKPKNLIRVLPLAMFDYRRVNSQIPPSLCDTSS